MSLWDRLRALVVDDPPHPPNPAVHTERAIRARREAAAQLREMQEEITYYVLADSDDARPGA